MKIEDLKAQFKDEAERQVKTSLTLEQIGKQENIAATDDEVEKSIIIWLIYTSCR